MKSEIKEGRSED